MRYLFAFFAFIGLLCLCKAQNLPLEVRFSADGKRLVTGGHPTTGLYNEAKLDTVELIFDQANWQSLLANNYLNGTPIPAKLIYGGQTLDSVGVNYKGFTSYGLNNSQKKSLNIALDWKKNNQDIDGYETLNLNCNFDDHSAMREVLFNHIGRNYVPALKSNYVYLKINGQPWAVYTNTQQLDGEFIKDWFQSNDGIRWRAIKPNSSPGGGGGMGGGSPFGAGTSSLNYLGADTNLYKPHYTLKSSNLNNPWTYLRDATYALHQMPASVMPDSLGYFIDVDKVLWFLAHEIAFADEDGYVFKGGMDYFVYYEPESGTLFPLEFDGNSSFGSAGATWSPFYRESDTRFVLCNKLFKVQEYRQRYLAHLRYVLENHLLPTRVHARIDTLKVLIDDAVKNEPKRIYTYTQFNSGVSSLKNWVTSRYNFLKSHAEVAQTAPNFSYVARAVGGVQDQNPTEDQTVEVTAKVASNNGISSVWLYHSNALFGRFTRTEMFDDGVHADGAANDGVYGASIPAYGPGTWVRYYVEARANNAAQSAAFWPEGAEHDVFVYQVALTSVASDVVINELVAANNAGAKDEFNQFEDWIELFNKGNTTVNISGYHITDNPANLKKWQIPNGTSLMPGEYLILWCDEDSSQGKFHTNFKLAKSGEQVMLLTPSLAIADSVTFGPQMDNMGYARRPNGTGSFVVQAPTFSANNNVTDTDDLRVQSDFRIFPNPANGLCTIIAEADARIFQIRLMDAQGRTVTDINHVQEQAVKLDLGSLGSGLYFLQINQSTSPQKLVILK